MEIRPRPAPGRPPSAKRAVGFTLIEVLVVVALAGIILMVAAVNLFPSNAEVARRESGMVALALERARDAAWFGGRPTAITFDEGRLREWRLAGDAWQPDAAHDRAIAEGVVITALFVEGQPLTMRDRLVFLPDGLGVPFRVAMEVHGLPWAIEGDVAGAITLVER
jgi:general secretion pathway protein H